MADTDTSEQMFGPEDPTSVPTPEQPTDPMIGRRIGQYSIKDVIGSGGMGTVYLAVQENPFGAPIRPSDRLFCPIRE